MFGKNIFIVLTTIVVNINVIYCVTCTFGESSLSGRHYECLLLNQNIESDEDLNRIDGSHVDGFTDADVSYLRAENSNITYFPSLLIDHFRNLTFVDLSGVRMKFFNNSITHCDNLYGIYLNRNEINTFSGGIFQNCAKLGALYMEENGLRFVDSIALAGTNITSLYMQKNRIEFLQPGIFGHIPYLETLFISDNLIEEVLPGTFDSTPNLLSIILSGNKLTSWSAHNLPNIFTLNLNNNQITAIPSGTFVGMPKLFLLDLGNNSITEIPTLEGLNHLTWLSFTFNKLKHVQVESFRNLLSLHYLYLSYNEIETLNFTTRSANILPNMYELSFSGNQLEAVENFILPVNLTSISFSYNKLSQLQTRSIEPISQLRFLYVENNEIRRIDRDFFDNVTELTLYMRDNNCYNDNFTFSNRDEFNQKESLLQICFNSATNLISSVFVLVASVFCSMIFKY